MKVKERGKQKKDGNKDSKGKETKKNIFALLRHFQIGTKGNALKWGCPLQRL